MAASPRTSLAEVALRSVSAPLNPIEIADRIDAAATLIEHDGLNHYDFWPDALTREWAPGTPACVIGAIGVVCGYTTSRSVLIRVFAARHPVLVAVLQELRCGDNIGQLMAWSDSARADQVAARLREAADNIRPAVELVSAVSA